MSWCCCSDFRLCNAVTGGMDAPFLPELRHAQDSHRQSGMEGKAGVQGKRAVSQQRKQACSQAEADAETKRASRLHEACLCPDAAHMSRTQTLSDQLEQLVPATA